MLTGFWPANQILFQLLRLSHNDDTVFGAKFGIITLILSIVWVVWEIGMEIEI